MRKLLAVMLLALVGCAGQKVVTEPASAGSNASPTATPAKAAAATVGNSLELKGVDPTTEIRATLMKVVDPGTPGEYGSAGAGKRLVGIQIRIENTGTAVYNDAPGNGARLVDAAGQQYSEEFAEIREGAPFEGVVTMSVGDNRVGTIVFAVPAGQALRSFQFALNSGFGPDTGEWVLS